MNTKKLILAMTILWGIFSWTAKADVTKKIGSSDGGTTLSTGADFLNLGAAFTAIIANTGGIYTGVITLQIIDNTTEPAKAVLNSNANWTTINIYPTVTGKTIGGDLSDVLIWLTGVGHVTIDGRLNATGSTRDLTISNTGGATLSSATAIRFDGGSSNNTIKYCTIKGSSTSVNRATIMFVGSGNSNNTISNNLITNANNAKRPEMSIYSSGSTTANDNNKIQDNEFKDCMSGSAASSSYVIWLSTLSTNWTISGNSFYETAPIAPSTATAFTVIAVAGTTTGHTISNNYIGSSDKQCTGSNAFTKTNAQTNAFTAISLVVGATPITTLSNNTIQKIDWTNPATGPDIKGIEISGGVNAIGNTIGATTGTGSINCTLNGQSVYGIKVSSSTGAVVLSNNNIGSITTNLNTAVTTIYGIYNDGSSNVTISNNTIGSTTTGSSINASASTSSQILYCMRIKGTGTNTISGNTISNISNGSTNSGNIWGMYIQGGTNVINGNFINKLSFPGGTGSATAMAGINIITTAASSTSTFSNNIISLGESNQYEKIYGIWEQNTTLTATSNIYFNTVYIGGTVASTSNGSYCIWSANASTSNRNIKNNILVSARSSTGASNLHYSLYATAGSGTFTCDYNDYVVSGTASVLGNYAAANVTTGHVIVTGQDANSIVTDPTFTSPGTTAGSYLPTSFFNGLSATGVTTDFGACTRAGTPKMGALEGGPLLAGTTTVSSITSTTASSGSTVNSIGSSLVTARGICWKTTSGPLITDSHTTDGSGSGSFTSSITGLTANTTYYVRSYATNTTGTSYGAEISFNSAKTPIITGAASATAFTTTYGTASTAQSFAVSAVNLTADLVATAPTGFEVSSDGGTTYGSSATFSKSGSAAGGTLKVRLAANAAVSGTYNSQNIVLSSTEATSVNIVSAASGNTVTAKALTITATVVNKTYGSALTGGSGSTAFTSSGLQNSETIGTVTITYGTGSAANAAVATYSSAAVVPSAATGGTFIANNYAITYASGNIIVGTKTLTITADNKSIAYGTAASTVTITGTYTATGFITGEDATVISGSISYSTTYTNTTVAATSGVSITPIVTSLTATNYSFTPADGTITVSKATPSISLQTSTVNYSGSAQSAIVNGSVTGSASNVKYNGSATAPTAVGSYAVTANFAPTDNTNYSSLIDASAGTFSINATVPDTPTVVTATAGNTQVSVAFTVPSNNGGSTILDYTVTPYIGATPGTTVTGSASPIAVTGLTNGTAYTFTVTARNSVGSSSASDASNSVTPVSPSVTVLANANLSSYSPSSATDVTVSAGELTVDDNFSVKTMTVAPGAKLTLASGKTLTVVGALTLQSDDAHGTATFVDNDGSTLSTGSIDVQRYLKGGRNWYISSPVSSATANVFNVASSKDIVYNYSESTGTNNPWPQISTGSTALNVMQGYVVKLNTDTTINFTGTLNTGEQTTSFNRTIGQVKEGFNLVGNPYLSYVNIKDIQTSDTVHIETSYWLRSRNSGNTAYVFDTYNLKSGIGVANSGLKLTKYIPPMQAFWVRVKQGFTTGSLTLHNTLRAHQDSVYNVFRAPAASELTQQILRLQVSNGVITDETVLYTNSNASNGLDDYDSQKMNEGNITIPQIYTLAGTEQLAINGLNNISYDLEMPLGLTISTSGTFSLKASQISNFVSGTQLILKDYANIDSPINTDLSDGNTYSFSSGATTNNTSRFTLTFRAPSVATEINSTEKGSFWISTNANGQIIVNGNSSENTLVTIYNALGQKIVSKNITHANAPLGNSLQAGVYMITVSNAGKSITKKIIID